MLAARSRPERLAGTSSEPSEADPLVSRLVSLVHATASLFPSRLSFRHPTKVKPNRIALSSSPVPPLYELISLTHSHAPPPPFSFQRLTFPSPPLTASTLPARLQLTLQTISGKVSPSGSKGVVVQGEVGEERVWMRTVRSYERGSERGGGAEDQ